MEASADVSPDLAVLALGGLDGGDVAAVYDAGAHGLAGIRVFQDDEERRRLVLALLGRSGQGTT